VTQRRTYTIEEAARLLGVGRGTCYDAARRNALPVPVIRVGRRMLVSKAALDSKLEEVAPPQNGGDGLPPAA
jgi:excisionase family DNA binding protein